MKMFDSVAPSITMALLEYRIAIDDPSAPFTDSQRKKLLSILDNAEKFSNKPSKILKFGANLKKLDKTFKRFGGDLDSIGSKVQTIADDVNKSVPIYKTLDAAKKADSLPDKLKIIIFGEKK